MSRSNFVQCQLAAPALVTDTALTIKVEAAFTPPPADGGLLVLTDSLGRPTAFEVVRYSARGALNGGVYQLSGVTRGLEGTSARAWAIDSFAYQSMTVGDLDAIISNLQGQIDGKLGSAATAAAATKLATARSINGIPFDGTGNITIADSTKEPAIAAGTVAQYLRGDKTWRDLATDIRAAVLTSLSTTTNAAIAATDTVLAAFGKLQAQITGLASSKLDATATATAATKLATARTIALTGDVSGSATFDGSANVSITAVVADDSHAHIIADVDGLQTALDAKLPAAGGALTGVLLATAGSMAAPAYSFSGDTNSGLYSDNADKVYVAVGGTRAAYFGPTEQLNYGHIYITTPDDVAADATTTTRDSGSLFFRTKYWNGTANTAYDWQIFADAAGSPTQSSLLRIYSGGASRAALDSSGNFTAVGNVTAYSDVRLKTDIQVIPDALAKVEQLRGVTYTRLDNGSQDTGLIAQEVLVVLPEAVHDDGEHLSVAYGNMVGLLVEAVKELSARVKALEART